MTNATRIESYNRRLDDYMDSGGDLYPRPLTPFTDKEKKEHITCLATPFLAPTPEIKSRSKVNIYSTKIINWITGATRT